MLEEVPDVEYADIGGLTRQIEQIRDAVELPFLHADLFREYQLRPPKGVLLYGPPGCGKTLIAKAVANSLAKQVALSRGEEKVTSYFLNIKGPELLNKYVGETERTIRLIFQRAREKASDGTPVIVFFDEMDSVFRTRGTGVSSDVETTIVPQLLSEIDGVEGLENVIVIGASNREDMIDPAILRPGRLDVKIKIERPDAEAARDIFTKYLIPELPIHPDDLAEFGGDRQSTISAMIQHTVERMYTETDENRFLEVTYANGDKEVLYFKDFNSGAMIQNIVDRAKKAAIKDRIVHGADAANGLAGARSCSTRSPTSSPRTRTCRTPPIRTTGRASPARRASGSSTSAPWCPASSPRAPGPSTPRRTPVSTCSPSGVAASAMPPTGHDRERSGASRARTSARPRRRARWAIGTAVLGRPAYISTGSAAQLPADRSVEAFRDNTFRVLDAAVAAGIDWIDTARSYGRAEEFVGQWWRARAGAGPGLGRRGRRPSPANGATVRRRLGPGRRRPRGQGTFAGGVRPSSGS